jgi:histidinol-phosphate/aromatic aminotransferase/cobyric acid decarboxylase-like protein
VTRPPPIGRPPEPGAHGGDGARVAAWLGVPVSAVLDLSVSLNPVAPDVAAVAAGLLDAVGRYPDPAAATDVLAATLGVDRELLVLTNGAAEAIALVAAEERIGGLVEPEFSLYRRHLDRVDEGAPRWRSNPSNPAGTLAPPDATARVWDEAFYPLAAGRWTRGDSDAWRLGSLTKVWACPGLRLGYVIAPDDRAAARLRHRQPRWSVNGLALGVVERLVPLSSPTEWTSEVARLRQCLGALLRDHDLPVDDTDSCWVLVHRPGLRQLLAPHGVVVRDCTSFGLPGVARVAVPDDAGRQQLSIALERGLG